MQVGLALSAVVTLVDLLLRGYGNTAQSGNTSILPINYLPAWLTLLGVIWIARRCSPSLRRCGSGEQLPG